MKLRLKIIIIFILSIIISIFVFIIATAYLASTGMYSGISEVDMRKAADGIIAGTKGKPVDAETFAPVFRIWRDKYKGMEFELLSEDLKTIYATSGNKASYTFGILGERLSHHGAWGQKEWVVFEPIPGPGSEKGYVLISVSRDNYVPFAFTLNGKGAGILGKIFLAGVGITLVVSNIFAVLFTIRISRRFSRLSRGINSFELGNLDVTIPDRSRDEIGKLAAAFNSMSVKLKRQVDQEKEFQEERRKLVSNISHDLRTPLTSIIGYSESLGNGIYENEEERSKHINTIWKSSLYMEKLIDELLELSRMEAPNFELNLKEDDLAELSREILIEYIPQLEEKGIELNAEIPEHPVKLSMDRDRIARVLRNLLGNAVKYGEQGKYLGFSIRENAGWVTVSIQDKGIGIDEENLDRIFERFFRADKARSSREGGMGLGLSIAQEIVKKHGGKIEVESEKGKGTTFIVSLPGRPD